MLTFAHVFDTLNIGDIVSGPYGYFRFPPYRVQDIRKPIPPKCDVAIFGGGALGPVLANRARAKVNIAWGVGFSRQGMKEAPPAPAGFKLYGSREYGQPNTIYAPCPSCMLSSFKRKHVIKHDVVFYHNADRRIKDRRGKVEELPTLNNEASLKEAMSFLGSAETVVTDSYHGCYWATLLGRKVICLPHSSKFYGFKHPPVMATAQTWRDKLKDARAYPDALEDAREFTWQFYERVMNELGPLEISDTSAPSQEQGDDLRSAAGDMASG